MNDASVTDAAVIVTVAGRVGRLLLNRPQALNALDPAMLRTLRAALAVWREAPALHAVVIDSTSDRAFCAGGDIRLIRGHASAGEAEAIERFFAEEYGLDADIAQFPKPYVALVDGICMGGGVGVAVHGAIRVATEHAAFAMPETGIGMFPDIGATYFLPRLPGSLGIFLGLTGHVLRGADAVHAGLATHFVPRARLPTLRTALAAEGVAAVAPLMALLPDFSLAPHRPAIDRCFSADSLPEILDRLAAEASDWARATIATLRGRSPSSLCWSLAAMRRGAELELPAALAAELRLACRATRHPDFAEGVRAMVVDKDRAPRWTPPTVEQVDPVATAEMLR